MFDRIYNGKQIWMKSYGYYAINWKQDNNGEHWLIEIKIKVKVQSYATAWNAMWARSAAQMKLNYVNFIH